MAEGTGRPFDDVVRQLAAVDPVAMTGEELADAVLDAQRLAAAAQAAVAALSAEFEARGRWQADGARSASAWIAARTGQRTRRVGHEVRTGRTLQALPVLSRLARDGEIGIEHVRVVAVAHRRFPEQVERDEAVLADWARHESVGSFAASVQRWASAARTEPDGPTPPAPTEFVRLEQRLDGWWDLTGRLAPKSGELLAAALDAGVHRRFAAAREGDPEAADQSAEQHRAAALVDLAAQESRDGGRHSAPDRYRVGLLLTPDQLAEHGELCCDSAFYRVVLGAEREILELGRLQRLHSGGQRRAAVVRDGGCVFPGCDRPPGWCDVHHNRLWEEGGETDLDNLSLLCRRHHVFIHANGWWIAVQRPRGRPVVFRPDGTVFRLPGARSLAA